MPDLATRCTPVSGNLSLMADDSSVMNARRRVWRRLLVMHGAAIALGVIASASRSDPTVAVAIAAFAALTLPPAWFLFFRTPPRDPQ